MDYSSGTFRTVAVFTTSIALTVGGLTITEASFAQTPATAASSSTSYTAAPYAGSLPLSSLSLSSLSVSSPAVAGILGVLPARKSDDLIGILAKGTTQSTGLLRTARACLAAIFPLGMPASQPSRPALRVVVAQLLSLPICVEMWHNLRIVAKDSNVRIHASTIRRFLKTIDNAPAGFWSAMLGLAGRTGTPMLP